MLIDSSLLAAIVVLGISAAGIWTNPKRAVNRAFLTQSVHVAVWLTLLDLAFSSKDGLIWLRWASAVGAFFPLHFVVLKEAITTGVICPRPRRRAFAIAALLSFALGALCFTDWYIPSTSTPEEKLFGVLYFGYLVIVIGAYTILAWLAFRESRHLQGVRRLELQLLLIGGCFSAIVILVLIALSALTNQQRWVLLIPLVTLIPYAATAWAITSARVFDSGHLLRLGLQRGLLIGSTTLVAWILTEVMPLFVLDPLASLLVVGLSLWFAALMNGGLQTALRLDARGGGDIRRSAYDASRRETRLDRLIEAFVHLLKGWGKTDHAVIFFGEQAGAFSKVGGGTAIETLQALRWVTPERLNRERMTPERRSLQAYMQENDLGAMITSGASNLLVVIGVGVRASRRPFTYPEITQLAELCSIIETSLARSHYSVKAQHAEQLATVGVLGASLAHEIRNPLVSIKTFVQLLPHHYQDQAFRDKFFRLIGDEVGRIDRLTEQLLDLAAPRAFNPSEIALHPVLQASLELVEAKASEKDVELIPAFEANPDTAYADPNAAKQVLLNLCFNAIQAIENRPGPRWVKISTRRISSGLELAVTDNGPGIPEDVRPRLFQPFQTTKSTGFGLGLAICSDIVAGLGGTITADPAMPGAGATFRVLFPCQRPTS